MPNVITACYPLLVEVNNEQFKKSVLPALQKAMLRNPEIILECVELVISGVHLDLSSYAMEIGNSLIGMSNKSVKSSKFFFYKLISANLHSKDDNARNEAADACKSLAGKIKDFKALEDILKKTFGVFHGSDGKLTVVDHKISVLQVYF